jgi:pimeloyl-ACP methyl ester carboxylesterase
MEMKKYFFSNLPTLFILFLISCSNSPELPMDQLVNIGTHKLHIYCAGAGSPTVVIDTGIMDTYEGWLPLIDQISQETTVCAYERAGYGQSEPGPMPRDSEREAEELNLLLKNAGLKPPFLLVGHSLGGLNMQVFAERFPDQVAGAILLDPPPIDWLIDNAFPELRQAFSQQTEAFKAMAEAARDSSDDEEKKKAAFFEAVASENENLMRASAAQAASIDSFGDFSLVIIGATKPNPNFGESAQDFQQFWLQRSEALAGKSNRGSFIRAEGSSHYIHLDAPQLVLETIHQMVGQISQDR